MNTLLMFWASWCHKCEQEFRTLVPSTPSTATKALKSSVSLTKSATREKAIKDTMTWPNVSQPRLGTARSSPNTR